MPNGNGFSDPSVNITFTKFLFIISPIDDDAARTRVRNAGGLIARVGHRLIESVARMTMDGFYRCLATRLGGAGLLGSS